MEGADRRQRRRMPLRLRVVRIERLAGGCQVVADAWTTNVSAGGMYVMLSGRDVPTRGAEVAFELAVPAGEGYSSSEGRIRGTGTVVRSDPAGAESPGVAVAFVRPLALDF